MQHNFITLIILFLLIAGLTEIQAQHSISASGGDVTGSSGTISFSVGQMTYTTITGTNGSIEQGVQHAYVISSQTGINEGIVLKHSIFPNPVNDYLTLQIDNSELTGYSFHLYDISGRLLQSQKIYENNSWIYMGDLKPATYMLKIYRNERTIKTFKIIKN
jgi:hypothetical protein